jgi:hypothetical protein
MKSLLPKSASGNRPFAALRSSVPVTVSGDSDDSAFQSTAGRFNLDHFQSIDKKKKYLPVFTLIRGIKEVKSIGYDANLRQSYYEMTEGNSYTLDSRVFLDKTPGDDSTLEINCNRSQFVNPSKMEELIASPYDQFAWKIIPAKVAKDIAAMIRMTTKVKISEPDFESLNLDLNIYLKIKFDRWHRVVEIIQDVSLALATTIIAMVGLLQKIDSTSPWIFGLLLVGAGTFFIGIVVKVVGQWLSK